MPRVSRVPLRMAAVVLCLSLMTAYSAAANEAVKMLSRYFELLATGNFESAAGMWTEAALERSSRFDIQYAGVPLKVDAASPIVLRLEVMRHYLEPPVKHLTVLPDSNVVQLTYSALAEGKVVEHTYYAQFDGAYYWLIYPQDYFCRDWKVFESRYFRVHGHPRVERFLNRAVLEEADQFVRRLADSLAMPQDDLKAIEARKIEYFYCDSDETVGQITGERGKGSVDPASNDIISSFFPNYYEVVRLLVNAVYKQVPPATHPLLGRGLAVCYGGRWGKTPAALFGLGSFLLNENIVEIDSLLTASGFESHAASDIAYPVAGLFTTYLLRQSNPRSFKHAYLALSGSREEVDTLGDSAVRREILAAVKQSSWTDLMQDFESYVKSHAAADATVQPGSAGDTRTIVNAGAFAISDNRDWLVFEFAANAGEPLSGNLLFGPDVRLSGAVSAMFEEQYQDRQGFDGYRYGIRFDANESGLYDYAANLLLEKYIVGISPAGEYLSPGRDKITVRFRKSLFGAILPTEKTCKLIPL
ncbi:MAG TPA: hypothetical protein VN285_12675 [Candidatus Deferrimicrobium sp.]|nr:hypothetical protein [Candidatus Deferrimicrobium sp.]